MSLSDTPIDHPHAIKVPSYGAGGTPSYRRRPDDPPRCTVHTTQGPPGTGRNVASWLKSAYSLLVEVQAREVLQCLPLNWTAHSLVGGPGVHETNHSGRMHPQVSIVGYAEDMHLLSASDLDWLAEVVFAPIVDLCGVPNTWRKTFGEMDHIGPPYLASKESPARMDWEGWYRFTGFCGHQHVPGQDHWDPGKLDVTGLEQRLTGGSGSGSGDDWATVARFAKKVWLIADGHL